jgi:hypothetical protein
MLKTYVFRFMLLITSFLMFSFANLDSSKLSKGTNDDTARKFWGWGCPVCSVDPNGTLAEWSCTSTYYVLGVGVSTSSCSCISTLGYTNCESCVMGNQSCGYSSGN